MPGSSQKLARCLRGHVLLAPDVLTVSLDINDGGMLGRTVRSWTLSDLKPQFGTTTNSVTSITDIRGVHLKAGDSYYLLMTPADPTTLVAWNINSVGTIDTRLVFPGDMIGCGNPTACPQVADLSAFRILGTQTGLRLAADPAAAVPDPFLSSLRP